MGHWKTVRDFAQAYTVSLIVGGLIGNGFCMRALLTNPTLKGRSATQYLLALALSDMSFLVVQIFAVLDLNGIPYAHIPGMCQLYTYVQYVTCFLSGWYTMALACERAAMVQKPLFALKWNVSKARKVVVCLTLLGLLVNIWVCLLTEASSFTVPMRNSTKSFWLCGIAPEWRNTATEYRITVFDTFVSFTIPLMTILPLNIFIVCKIIGFNRKNQLSSDVYYRNRNQASKMSKQIALQVTSTLLSPIMGSQIYRNANFQQHSGLGLSLSTVSSRRSSGPSSPKSYRSIKKRHNLADFKVTLLLLAVSFGYLVLNLPQYAIKLLVMFNKNKKIEFQNQLLMAVFHLMFCTQFAINFLFYTCVGVVRTAHNRSCARKQTAL